MTNKKPNLPREPRADDEVVSFFVAILVLVGFFMLFMWWFGIGFFGDYCGESDSYVACHNYGIKCVSGGSCGWACQKMANVENRSVYCECPCELCTKPTCLRKTWYPESWSVYETEYEKLGVKEANP